MATTTTAEVELEMAPMTGDSSSIVLESTPVSAKGIGTPSRTLEAAESGQIDSPPPPPSPTTQESVYPTGANFYFICLAICFVLILGGIDGSIVSTAVPAITDHFHTLADVGWYSAAYRLSTCALQFTIGKLYKIFPVKRVFLVCVTVFLVGSVLCAAATSSKMFVVGRAVTGAGAAGFLSGCFVLLTRIVPLRKRPIWQSSFYAVELIFTKTAPVLGGVLIQKLSWRWCFWINLPLGAVVLPVIAFVLPDANSAPPLANLTRKEVLQHLDLVGNLVFIPALTCLFMALSWAGSKYSWNSPTVIGLFVTFAVLTGAFLYDQYVKQDRATLPPRIMKNRSVIAAMIYAGCASSASSVIQYYMPTYFQAVKGYSPAESGAMMLPFSVFFTVFLLLAGRATSKIGYHNPFLLIASTLMPIGAGLMTKWDADTSRILLIVYSSIIGIASGMGSQGPSTAVQASLPEADISLGIATVFFATNFGPAVSIPVAQTIFTSRLSANLDPLANQDGLNVTSIESLGLTGVRNSLGPNNLQDVVRLLSQSLSQTWYLAVGLACVPMVGALTMEWRSVKQKTS